MVGYAVGDPSEKLRHRLHLFLVLCSSLLQLHPVLFLLEFFHKPFMLPVSLLSVCFYLLLLDKHLQQLIVGMWLGLSRLVRVIFCTTSNFTFSCL